MTQAGMSERRLGSVGEMTPERLAELRRIAEAADFLKRLGASDETIQKFYDEFNPPTVLALLDEIEQLWAENQRLVDDIKFITAPVEVGGGADAYLRYEVDRLRRERETLAGGLREAEIVLADWCSVDRRDPESAIHDKAPKFVNALALLDGEKGGDRRE